MKRILTTLALVLAACSGNTTNHSGEPTLDSGVPTADAAHESGIQTCSGPVPSGPCAQPGLLCLSEGFGECRNCRFSCTSDGWQQRECESCGYGPCGIGGCQMPDGGCGTGRPTPLGYLCISSSDFSDPGKPDPGCSPLLLETTPSLEGCCRRDGTCGYLFEASCIAPSVLLRDPKAASVTCPADAGADGGTG